MKAFIKGIEKDTHKKIVVNIETIKMFTAIVKVGNRKFVEAVTSEKNILVSKDEMKRMGLGEEYSYFEA